MVLNKKFLVTICLFIGLSLQANAQNEVFYTDKYEVNYFSNNQNINTEMYFGSNLFQFISFADLNDLGRYIDSFLVRENINFDKNILIENENRIKVTLEKLNADECYSLSKKWSENYKLDFLKLLNTQIKSVNEDSINWTSQKIILYNIVVDELIRFYNPSNSVNNVNIAFVIPKKLSENDFKKTFIHFNTKRNSIRVSNLTATEIVTNESLSANQMLLEFPSLNKQTFMKNCLSLQIYQNVTPIVEFKTNYHINQCITSFVIEKMDTTISNFKMTVDTNILTPKQFTAEVQKAIKQIIAICNEQLFYYSYYDIQMLLSDYIQEDYKINEFNVEIDRLNELKNFILSVNENNNFKLNDSKLLTFKILDFDYKIPYKNNSIEFENEADTLVLNKIKQFLEINPEYSLTIVATSKPSEFLFIEKQKRLDLIEKYTDTGFSMSKKKNLALYRSLIIFDQLTKAGIDYKRMKCIGLTDSISELELDLSILEPYKK